ncbi:MAG TPA: hypothetical protein VFW38_04070 [Solirubrobacteraceae bacterium]|nr:hypothetical protein [Solirubrobacteraceae bacterium]
MSAAPRTPVGSDRMERPSLRLLKKPAPGKRSEQSRSTEPVAHSYADRVLVAGADPAERARMLAELRSLLPADTDFRQASETWEVVAQASDSRMVVLAGDLGETSASALLRLLGRRNPALPVLAVGSERRAQAPAQGRDPSDGGYRPAADAAQA